jgi:hypothetical protein
MWIAALPANVQIAFPYDTSCGKMTGKGNA